MISRRWIGRSGWDKHETLKCIGCLGADRWKSKFMDGSCINSSRWRLGMKPVCKPGILLRLRPYLPRSYDRPLFRYFDGVQGDAQRQGELFGIKNMFKLNEGLSTKMTVRIVSVASFRCYCEHTCVRSRRLILRSWTGHLPI